MKKEKERVIKEAKKRGWFLQRQKRHYIYKHAKGGCVTISKTESEFRSWREIRKDFIHQERLYHKSIEMLLLKK